MTWIGTLLLNGPLVVGAYLVARFGLRQPGGAPRWLGAAVLGWVWVVLGVASLGSIGWLRLDALGAWSGLILVTGGICWWVNRTSRVAGVDGASETRPILRDASAGDRWTVSGLLALALTGIVCLVFAAQALVGPVEAVSDGPIYHLYFAIRWWKAARLELVPAPFGENAAPYFPANGDAWFAWLVVGWGGDRPAKAGQAPFLAMAGVAAFALARRLGAGRSAAAIAVCWFVTCTPLLLFSFDPNVDTIFVAGYLAAAFFLLRYAIGDDGPASLVLGGLAAGAAWGTKPTGLVFVPPLVLLGGLGVAVRGVSGGPGRLRRIATHGSILAGATAPPVAFWYGRNAWWTGNPLYPLDVPAMGWVGWYGRDVMRLSHFYIPRGEWRALGDIVVMVLDPRMAPFWALAVLGAWAIGRGGRRLRGWVALLGALAVLNVALYWVAIPYRTQQRFFLQALGLAVVPLARLLDRGMVLRGVAVGLLAVHLGTPQGWPAGIRGWVVPWRPGGLVPTDVGAPWRVWTQAGSWGRPDPFFPMFRDYWAGWHRLDRASGRDGARVAYAGTNIPYYLFGRGLRNEVRYVNVDGHRDWRLHDYHREAVRAGRPHWPYPRPGWDRMQPDFDAWWANLMAEGIELLVVTRAVPEEGPHNPNPADPLGFPIERAWAEGHPERFRPLYGVEEGEREFRVYRVVPGENRENQTESGPGPH